MGEVIKVEINKALAERFRRKAMELYGYKKGAIKRAIEDLVRKFSFGGEADWSSLKGKLNFGESSVELQHKAWARVIDSSGRKHNP
ncbi:MAG: hypothetical protein QXG01_00820 [Candidatus Bathyarchaeia archaeon]